MLSKNSFYTKNSTLYFLLQALCPVFLELTETEICKNWKEMNQLTETETKTEKSWKTETELKLKLN